MTLFKKRETIDKSELMFSGKALVKMMIPLMLQQMLNMTVGMINSIMVSGAGDAAVSAVSTLDGGLIYPLGFFYPSVFCAASDVRFPLVVSVLSMWLRVGKKIRGLAE